MIYLSETANNILKSYFPDVSVFHRQGRTYDPVDAHPDMFMCRFSDGTVFHADLSEIGKEYPENIAYNALCLDKYFIHNLKYTSKRLLNEAKRRGMELIHVKQGYTKCSCVFVNGRSVITSDDGISKTLSAIPDIDILKVSPGYVCLRGFEYGFIGGASGLVGDKLVFSGDITKHPDFAEILKFCLERNVEIEYFEYPLEDIGSILEELPIKTDTE